MTTGLSYLPEVDRVLPPLLAREAGLAHAFVSGAPTDEGERTRRAAVMAEHSDGMDYHPIVANYAAGKLDLPLPEGTQIAFGQTFEASRAPPGMGGPDPAPIPDDPAAILSAIDGGGARPRDLWMRALARWIEIRKEHPHPLSAVTAPDQRYHFDQRSGAWVGQVQRCADLVPHERFYPGCSAMLIAALSRPPWAERQGGARQKAIVAALAPKLDRVPYNMLPGYGACGAGSNGFYAAARGGRRAPDTQGVPPRFSAARRHGGGRDRPIMSPPFGGGAVDQRPLDRRQQGIGGAQVGTYQLGGLDPGIEDAELEPRSQDLARQIDIGAFAQIVRPRFEGQPDRQHSCPGRQTRDGLFVEPVLMRLVGADWTIDQMQVRPDIGSDMAGRARIHGQAGSAEGPPGRV